MGNMKVRSITKKIIPIRTLVEEIRTRNVDELGLKDAGRRKLSNNHDSCERYDEKR